MIISLAFAGAWIVPKVAIAIEKASIASIDDAVGAFAVHGFCSFLGAILPGFFVYGFPQAYLGQWSMKAQGLQGQGCIPL